MVVGEIIELQKIQSTTSRLTTKKDKSIRRMSSDEQQITNGMNSFNSSVRRSMTMKGADFKFKGPKMDLSGE